MQIAQKIGSRIGEGLVTINLGWVAGLLGDYSSARGHLEHSIRIGQEIGDIYNQATSLVNLSLFATCQNETEVAKSYAQQGMALARETGNKHVEAFAATYLGHAVLAADRLEQAREWYQHGLDLRNQLGQQNLAMEPLAGIAEIEYRTQNLSAALEIVEDILDYLDGGGTLDGIDQPYRIYATCARILLDVRHPRAEPFIQEVYTMLQTQADKIKDEQSRKSFLSNVPFHGEIIHLYNQLDK
jgi:tetratricopeptide (TPR) repeat protein